jgi:hypothetical protein
LALPTDTTVFEYFPTWADALHAAGLIGEEDIPVVKRRTARHGMDNARVARALIAAVRELGPNVTRTEYSRWRSHQPIVFGTREAPDHWGLVRRYAPWRDLVALVRKGLVADDPQAEVERLLAELQR